MATTSLAGTAKNSNGNSSQRRSHRLEAIRYLEVSRMDWSFLFYGWILDEL
jgi:hypothetical protein